MPSGNCHRENISCRRQTPCSVHTGSDVRRRVFSNRIAEKSNCLSYDFPFYTAKMYVLIDREHTRHLVCCTGKLQPLCEDVISFDTRTLIACGIPRGDLRFATCDERVHITV